MEKMYICKAFKEGRCNTEKSECSHAKEHPKKYNCAASYCLKKGIKDTECIEVDEDPRIAALVGKQPVTIENAWVGAEVVDMVHGLTKIKYIHNLCSTPAAIMVDIKTGDCKITKIHNLIINPRLYWPNGIVQPKPRKTRKVKVNGYIKNGILGYDLFVISGIDANACGPEQEIEIEVYEEEEK